MMHPVKAISAPLPDVARAATHMVEVTSVDLESEPGSGSQHCFLPAVTFRRGHDLSCVSIPTLQSGGYGLPTQRTTVKRIIPGKHPAPGWLVGRN